MSSSRPVGVASDSDNDSVSDGVQDLSWPQPGDRPHPLLAIKDASPDSPPPFPRDIPIKKDLMALCLRVPLVPLPPSTHGSREDAAVGKPIEFILIGTGSSSAVPLIGCITDHANGCACCLSSLTHEGRRNNRANTGAIIRVPQPDGSEKIIMIDCGKTFRDTALKLFPEKGLRKIDALILTHHHADAVDGLDDLRAWTDKSTIQSAIKVYCTETTLNFVSAGFAYMVHKAAANGSGKVPKFEWHTFGDNEVLDLFGVRITPLPVHHGVYFTKPPKPLICHGFLINSSILYMSDVSYIPEATWNVIRSEITLPDERTGIFPPKASSSLPRLLALIIDLTGLRNGPSHFGLGQTMDMIHRLGPDRTYFTDLPHLISHECWLHMCEALEIRSQPSLIHAAERALKSALTFPRDHGEDDKQPPAEHIMKGFDHHAEDFDLFVDRAREVVDEWMGAMPPAKWMRPAVDGMSIFWHEGDGAKWKGRRVWCDEYHV